MQKTIIAVCVLGALLVLGAVVAAPFYFKHYRIPQNGMYPTMPAGTFLVAKRRPYKNISEVAYGDVVVWHLYRDGERYSMVWRVLGLPGDTLQFQRKAVVLNGQPLKGVPQNSEGPLLILQEIVHDNRYDVAYDLNQAPPESSFLVPAGHLFLVGDNRDHAYDSRSLGAVPFESIVGKAVWWSGA